MLDDRSWETGKSQVANVCGANGVEGAGLIIFGGHWIHICMGT